MSRKPPAKQSRERYSALLKNLDRDAYIIDVTPNAVYLIGARRHSTYYAMIDFLYRATGTATYVIQTSDLGTTITNIATADSDQTGSTADTTDVVVPI